MNIDLILTDKLLLSCLELVSSLTWRFLETTNQSIMKIIKMKDEALLEKKFIEVRRMIRIILISYCIIPYNDVSVIWGLLETTNRSIMKIIKRNMELH